MSAGYAAIAVFVALYIGLLWLLTRMALMSAWGEIAALLLIVVGIGRLIVGWMHRMNERMNQ